MLFQQPVRNPCVDLEAPFFAAFKVKLVSSVWNGYGSALFVEFGALATMRRPRRKASRPSGELSLMIEWSWRIERPRSILGGSWSSEKRWPGMFQKLNGATVAEVELFGAIPEILVFMEFQF